VLGALALFLSCTLAHFNTGSADIWRFLWTVVPDQLGVLPGPLAGYPPAGAHAVELAGLAVLAGIVALAVTAGRARVRGWLSRRCVARGIAGRPLGGSSGAGGAANLPGAAVPLQGRAHDHVPGVVGVGAHGHALVCVRAGNPVQPAPDGPAAAAAAAPAKTTPVMPRHRALPEVGPRRVAGDRATISVNMAAIR